MCLCLCLCNIVPLEFSYAIQSRNSHAKCLLQAVPCYFKEKLNTVCGGNLLTAKCQSDYIFDFYMEKKLRRTMLVGPYWTSLIRMYNIQIGDVVSFTYICEDEDYEGYEIEEVDVTVYQVGVNGKEEKVKVENPGKI